MCCHVVNRLRASATAAITTTALWLTLSARGPRQNPLQACRLHQRLEALCFGRECLPAIASQPVVPTSFIGIARRRRGLLDPPRFHQPLKRSVEGPRSEFDSIVGEPLHVFRDGIAVPCATSECYVKRPFA